jgi:hypothetical protein
MGDGLRMRLRPVPTVSVGFLSDRYVRQVNRTASYPARLAELIHFSLPTAHHSRSSLLAICGGYEPMDEPGL